MNYCYYQAVIWIILSCDQGYRERNAYIATQLPLRNTIVDLWRLLYEQKCSCIITLEQPDPTDEVSYQGAESI